MASSTNNNQHKITSKDLYNEAWKCRDFEISHLWQRSVFLGAFLLAIAGGYGITMLKTYFPKTPITDFWKAHLLLWGLCWLGIILSILWIMMAKGSKYHYELYEADIIWFQNNCFERKTNSDMPSYGDHTELQKDKIRENIFSTRAAHYSVSKVNICIGIVSVIVWSLLCMIHFAKILIVRFKIENFQAILFSFSQFLFIGAILFFTLRFLCLSGDAE